MQPHAKPKTVSDYFENGLYYSEQKEYAEAIVSFTKVTELDPNHALAYFKRGFAYLQQKEYAKAIVDFTKMTELKPNVAMAYNNRGFAYLKQKEYAKAIVDCTQAIKLDPNIPQAYFNRGIAYVNQNECTKAIIDFTKVIALDPTVDEAYSNRGLAYYRQKEYAKTIADCTKAIELTPNDSMAYNNRGCAFQQQGNLASAMADYVKVLELEANDEFATKNLWLLLDNHTQAEIFAAIKTLPQDQKLALLRACLDETTLWGKRFAKEDGSFSNLFGIIQKPSSLKDEIKTELGIDIPQAVSEMTSNQPSTYSSITKWFSHKGTTKVAAASSTPILPTQPPNYEDYIRMHGNEPATQAAIAEAVALSAQGPSYYIPVFFAPIEALQQANQGWQYGTPALLAALPAVPSHSLPAADAGRKPMFAS